MAGIDLYQWRVVLAESFDPRETAGRSNLLVYDPQVLEPLSERALKCSERIDGQELVERWQRERGCARQTHADFYHGGQRLYHEARTPVSEGFIMDDLLMAYQERFGGAVTRIVFFPESLANVQRRISPFATDPEKARRWLEDIVRNPSAYSWEGRYLGRIASPAPG